MANRASQNGSAHHSPADGLSMSFARPTLDHPGLLRNFQSAPAPPNRQTIGNKRHRPGFRLSDIVGPDGVPGGGASAAGLGAGVPQDDDMPPRRPPPGLTSSPFSNFDKIV